jgi:hypothetical protein
MIAVSAIFLIIQPCIRVITAALRPPRPAGPRPILPFDLPHDWGGLDWGEGLQPAMFLLLSTCGLLNPIGHLPLCWRYY